MIYQLRANLYFSDPDAIYDILDKINDHFDDATAVNPDSENAEFSVVEVILNHHDEDPNASCDLVTSRSNQPD